MQSQVRFNRVPEKVPEKVWEALFGAGLGQVQQGSGEGFGGVEKIPEEVVGIFGAGPGQVQRVPEIRKSGEDFGEFFFWFLCVYLLCLHTYKNKIFCMLGIPPKLIFILNYIIYICVCVCIRCWKAWVCTDHF